MKKMENCKFHIVELKRKEKRSIHNLLYNKFQFHLCFLVFFFFKFLFLLWSSRINKRPAKHKKY